MSIDDGFWHQIEVFLERSLIRITIDGARTENRADFGDNTFLDLSGYCFIGGVSLQHRARAIERGLMSLNNRHAAAGSLIGCLQNLNLNGDSVGLREVQVGQ